MKRISITLFAFALVAVTGRADPIIYFGEDLNPGNTLPSGGSAEVARNNFLSSISEVGTETMEGFSARTTAPLSLIFVGSNGPTSANLTGTFTRPPFDAVWDSPFDGRFAISGTQYWQTSDAFELVLSDPVSAFGFFATDGGDGPGQLTLRLGISGGGERDVVVPHTVSESANGAVMFFGFTDLTATYSSISFLNSDAGHDFFGFDDWTVGTVASVPDPGTLLEQLGAAVIGVGPGKSLADKVVLAQTYFAVPDIQATCAMLTDFINQVQAQRGKKLTPALADQLTADAQAIMAAIGCN